MNNYFNSYFEFGLRSMYILEIFSDDYLSPEQLSKIDYLALYYKIDGLEFLHPKHNLVITEYGAHQNIIKTGLVYFTSLGYITVKYTSKGILYGRTSKEFSYIESNYSKLLKNRIYYLKSIDVNNKFRTPSEVIDAI